MNYNNFFEIDNFRNFYFGKSKYAQKAGLLDDFCNIWFQIEGRALGLSTFQRAKAVLNAQNKKRIKTQLMGYGYSAAGIDGLFKAIAEWIKANS